MALFENLQKASSEEDVKAVYIKALGLKNVQRNLIDIQTKEIWFETKIGDRISIYEMFTQLLYYIYDARKKGEYTPPFICVADSQKAAIMKTELTIPLLERNVIKWGKSASDVKKDAVDIVSQYIGTHFVQFRIETHEKEFIETVKNAIKTGEIIRTQITPNNLKQVFDKWVEMIGVEIDGASPNDYSTFFYADVMNDGQFSTHKGYACKLIYMDGKPSFLWNGKSYEIASHKGYDQFWAIYSRPPKEEYRDYLLERRDSLIPLDARVFKDAYYTPLHIVDKAYDLLDQTLGPDWQRDYVVWDMCCGVGNLEAKHSNTRNVFMSTLDEEDINIMRASKTCLGAEIFQYDYLNDDITDEGEIDYTLTKKIPLALQRIIQKDTKKVLVLINPPYGEATNADNTSKVIGAKNKAGIAKTKWAKNGMGDYGKATNELFTQFVTRLSKEIPNAVLGMFSKLKYVNSENFALFRSNWKATYLNGFVVHSKAFDGLKGEFPIGFLVWKTGTGTVNEITTEVLDKEGNPIGSKNFYNLPNSEFLSKWIARPKSNSECVIPLSNAITPTTMGKPRVQKWSDDALGYMCSGTNDLQNAEKYVYILSSAAARGNGFYVTKANIEKAAVFFAVSKLPQHTWLNDRDQFLQPNADLPSEFRTDCLVWMLFNSSNLTASANNLEWNGKKWSIVNHFIPYAPDEVESGERWESYFMVDYLADKSFSKEAREVLSEGKELWRQYFAEKDGKMTRDTLKLNRPDVGWYQVRKALETRNGDGGYMPVSFEAFQKSYRLLTEKLRPLVYEYGFLR